MFDPTGHNIEEIVRRSSPRRGVEVAKCPDWGTAVAGGSAPAIYANATNMPGWADPNYNNNGRVNAVLFDSSSSQQIFVTIPRGKRAYIGDGQVFKVRALIGRFGAGTAQPTLGLNVTVGNPSNPTIGTCKLTPATDGVFQWVEASLTLTPTLDAALSNQEPLTLTLAQSAAINANYSLEIAQLEVVMLEHLSTYPLNERLVV